MDVNEMIRISESIQRPELHEGKVELEVMKKVLKSLDFNLKGSETAKQIEDMFWDARNYMGKEVWALVKQFTGA